MNIVIIKGVLQMVYGDYVQMVSIVMKRILPHLLLLLLEK